MAGGWLLIVAACAILALILGIPAAMMGVGSRVTRAKVIDGARRLAYGAAVVLFFIGFGLLVQYLEKP